MNFWILDGTVDIHSLDIPVNAVATALKDFFSKRLPPLIDKDSMSQLEDISGKFSLFYFILFFQGRHALLNLCLKHKVFYKAVL